MQKIRAYPWPGNIRELENILERSILFATCKEMTELDLPLPAKTKNLEQWKDIKEQALAKAKQTFLESGGGHGHHIKCRLHQAEKIWD